MYVGDEQVVEGSRVFGFGPKKLFVFGDSYADTGNNRKGLASSWKFPYGITFPGKPAGRFSDGRVSTDYIGTNTSLFNFVINNDVFSFSFFSFSSLLSLLYTSTSNGLLALFLQTVSFK